MGCMHSLTGTDIVVATESSTGGTKAANCDHATKIHPMATDDPQEQQDGFGTTQIDPPATLQNNAKTNDKYNKYNDDFTTDYVILKQVMVGMSALSNIYMVMKRPNPTNTSDDDGGENDLITNTVTNATHTNMTTHPPESQPQLIDAPPQQTDQALESAAATTMTSTTPATTTNVQAIATSNSNTNHHSPHKNDGNTADNEIYVLQVIDMESVAPERRKSMRKEIIALQSIIHPNILRVHAVYDATRRDNTIATVTELCTGSHLQSSVPYPEPRAKKIIAQILDALQYMHQRKLFHNSLTTENILFQDDSQDAMIKITYAGVANLPSQSNSGSSKRFAIPEWNPSGKDIYSVGMIAYKLLSGGKEPPTDMDTQRVVPGTNLFLGRRWKLISISKNAKNFIERCLHSWDMKPQFTVEDALQHIWMTQEHVHRSDTSRPTDTINELGDVKWNDVGSSLTASEPAVFHSPDEIVPVVSLTAEQYTREVMTKALDEDEKPQLQPNDDENENSIPVFVNAESDTNVVVPKVDETVVCEVIDKVDENIVPDDVQTLAPQERLNDDKIVDDVAKTTDVVDTNEDATIAAVADNNAESVIPNACDDSPPLDISDTPTPDEFVDLRDAFHEVTTGNDSSGDNSAVTMEAFKERLRTRYTEEEVNSWFNGHEKYEDPKSLDYKVFLRKVIQNRKTIEIQRVDAAFKMIDKGKHGYVTVGNLRAVLGKDNNDNIEQLIKAADTNRDGKISYENFELVVQNYLSSAT